MLATLASATGPHTIITAADPQPDDLRKAHQAITSAS